MDAMARTDSSFEEFDEREHIRNLLYMEGPTLQSHHFVNALIGMFFGFFFIFLFWMSAFVWHIWECRERHVKAKRLIELEEITSPKNKQNVESPTEDPLEDESITAKEQVVYSLMNLTSQVIADTWLTDDWMDTELFGKLISPDDEEARPSDVVIPYKAPSDAISWSSEYCSEFTIQERLDDIKTTEEAMLERQNPADGKRAKPKAHQRHAHSPEKKVEVSNDNKQTGDDQRISRDSEKCQDPTTQEGLEWAHEKYLDIQEKRGQISRDRMLLRRTTSVEARKSYMQEKARRPTTQEVQEWAHQKYLEIQEKRRRMSRVKRDTVPKRMNSPETDKNETQQRFQRVTTQDVQTWAHEKYLEIQEKRRQLSRDRKLSRRTNSVEARKSEMDPQSHCTTTQEDPAKARRRDELADILTKIGHRPTSPEGK